MRMNTSLKRSLIYSFCSDLKKRGFKQKRILPQPRELLNLLSFLEIQVLEGFELLYQKQYYACTDRMCWIKNFRYGGRSEMVFTLSFPKRLRVFWTLWLQSWLTFGKFCRSYLEHHLAQFQGHLEHQMPLKREKCAGWGGA